MVLQNNGFFTHKIFDNCYENKLTIGIRIRIAFSNLFWTVNFYFACLCNRLGISENDDLLLWVIISVVKVIIFSGKLISASRDVHRCDKGSLFNLVWKRFWNYKVVCRFTDRSSIQTRPSITFLVHSASRLLTNERLTTLYILQVVKRDYFQNHHIIKCICKTF